MSESVSNKLFVYFVFKHSAFNNKNVISVAISILNSLFKNYFLKKIQAYKMEKQERFCSKKDGDENFKHFATLYSFFMLRVLFLENSKNETQKVTNISFRSFLLYLILYLSLLILIRK